MICSLHERRYFISLFLMEGAYYLAVVFLINHSYKISSLDLPCGRAENFRAGYLLDASGERAIFSMTGIPVPTIITQHHQRIIRNY